MPRYYAEICVWFDAENETYAREEMERAADMISQKPTTTASVNSVEEDEPISDD